MGTRFTPAVNGGTLSLSKVGTPGPAAAPADRSRQGDTAVPPTRRASSAVTRYVASVPTSASNSAVAYQNGCLTRSERKSTRHGWV